MDERWDLLHQWLSEVLKHNDFSVQPASSDASFRRYFRVQQKQQTWIVMDAPPEKENSHPFVHIAQLFEQIGLNVPKIYASDFEQGFFLLSDLGNTVYLGQLNQRSVARLYGDAIRALITLQTYGPQQGELPDYDRALLLREMQLFIDWYCIKYQQIQLAPTEQQAIASVFELLIESALAQVKVCVHRDYHSRNLMVCADKNPGILDFQDAVIGPVSYDLVSLLRDCYITWPKDEVIHWLNEYYQGACQAGIITGITAEQFLQWFDWMGIQRHLKAVGIFARLYLRDGKSGYLNDIPRTLQYIDVVAGSYPQLQALNHLIDRIAVNGKVAK